ncbi:MAG: hypothetical protein GXC70_12625 [Sphingomonadaceae bacterium]|nr:hypothetical protein [Sphingomonadaceae bacterium]
MDYTELTAIGLALALGLLIGVQRGWASRDRAPGQRFAGVRTHALFGLAGGIAGCCWQPPPRWWCWATGAARAAAPRSAARPAWPG